MNYCRLFHINQFQYISIKSYLSRVLFVILIIIVSVSYMVKTKFVVNVTVPTNLFVVINSSEERRDCIVYTRERSGRLGNRMFIVASAYGLARLHSCHLYLSPEIIHELKDIFIFNLSSPLLLSSTDHLKSMNRTIANIGCRYLPELTRPNAIPPGTIFELQGYWQSYLHFEKYRDEIREHLFAATQPILRKISKIFIDIYKEKFGITPSFSSDDHQLLKKQLAQSNLTTWIGMHIRRSDFTDLNFSSNDEYLFSSMKYYTSLYSNAHFLVATDDKPYCKKLFRNHLNIYFTPESFSPAEDLIALSICQHSIVTGGTFGWWIAYLTNGQVVHDKVYPSGCERREYYYPPWFMIDGKVRVGQNIE